ncbi:ornithine decarboxylase antizyme-domain-containing protein [Aspergillus ambiguus]|uniref:ornithine decarboxylase antizyme n=1 Tax=Aspergillus ambiguus TaxID=176160 RepID=UPI003CCD5F1E
MESVLLGTTLPENRGEATYTIPEECERLFCDSLSAIFLGERRIARQESLGMDAGQMARNRLTPNRALIERWFEVLDYTSDSVYRGFVTDINGDRTLFVFFGEGTLGQGLKTGLIALFELAAISTFDCSRIVACVPRSQNVAEPEIIRNLGWCGFNLTTLQPWNTEASCASPLSTKWLFLDAEV